MEGHGFINIVYTYLLYHYNQRRDEENSLSPFQEVDWMVGYDALLSRVQKFSLSLLCNPNFWVCGRSHVIAIGSKTINMAKDNFPGNNIRIAAMTKKADDSMPQQ